jgi:hypothetical protein
MRIQAGSSIATCAVGLLLTGCPSPNLYSTPRTIPKGKVSHTIAAEGVGYRVSLKDPDEGDYDNVIDDASWSSPTIPTYILRVGLADRLDFAFRVNALTSVGLDTKFNFVRSSTFDLAIDPMVQWAFALDVTHLHLPLVVGFNASEDLSVVLTPGVIYGYSDYDFEDDIGGDLARVMAADGLYARAGIGVNVRISPKFALQPELSVIRSLEDPGPNSSFDSVYMYVFGVGFNLANLPNFADADAAAPRGGD